MEPLTVDSVAAIRAQLWDAGFRPVPVLNADHPDPAMAGKAPLGKNWGNRARQDPPDCLKYPPVAHALNTGILTDGLRAIDIDIDDPEIATRCRSLVVQRFGEAPIRMRRNSPRCLILYRAATGTPPKCSLPGKHGKIEVLGKGQQFVAFGRHPSGADLEWFPDAPGTELLSGLPAVSEDDLHELLEQIAPIIGADPPRRYNGVDHAPGEAQADPLRIAAALHAIPNNGPADWEAWNRVGMAIWRATGGSDLGWDAWDAWSSRHPSYDAATTRARWDHYFGSPPDQIGAGTLFHMAAQAMPGQAPPLSTAYDLAETEPLTATPFDPEKFKTLEPRRWVYGHFLIRRFLSVMGAPGGAGKTTYAMSVGVCVALNRPLLGEPIHEAGPVWIYNLEDPEDEILRRLQAICLHHDISPHALAGRLYLDSGRTRPLIVAVKLENGSVVAQPVVPEMIAELKRRGIKLFIVDPFVKSHRLEENRNEQIDFAATLWNHVAAEADCAILLLHHFKKGGMSGEADAFRGASALVDAARAAVSLSTMNEKEASRLGIDEADRRFYVRVDNAKLNLAPPPTHAVWLKLNNVQLPNTDKVQAASRWEPPSMWEGVPMATVVRILEIIGAGKGGEQFTLKSNSADKTRWAGQVIVDEISHTEPQARIMLASWVKAKLIRETRYYSTIRRKEISGCEVDATLVAEMRQSIAAQFDE